MSEVFLRLSGLRVVDDDDLPLGFVRISRSHAVAPYVVVNIGVNLMTWTVLCADHQALGAALRWGAEASPGVYPLGGLDYSRALARWNGSLLSEAEEDAIAAKFLTGLDARLAQLAD